MLHNSMIGVGACALVLAAASSARAAVVGTLDDFQDLTPMGWSSFVPSISIKDSGGPLGTGDAYVRLTSFGGSGPGSRLATDNGDPRWTGSYLMAGLMGVEADFRNLGTSPLEIRAVVFGGDGNRFTSTLAGMLPGDGAWHHLMFSLDAGSLTNVMGSLTYADVMGDVTGIMFRHDSGTPDAGGTVIATTMGIDNVHSVPAPGAAGVLGLGALAWRGRSRRNCPRLTRASMN